MADLCLIFKFVITKVERMFKLFEKDCFGLPLPTKTAKFVSEIRMAELGHEYNDSISALEARLAELTAKLKFTPPDQKPDIEQRISLLRREIHDARKIGADAAGFYSGSGNALPKALGGDLSC